MTLKDKNAQSDKMLEELGILDNSMKVPEYAVTKSMTCCLCGKVDYVDEKSCQATLFWFIAKYRYLCNPACAVKGWKSLYKLATEVEIFELHSKNLLLGVDAISDFINSAQAMVLLVQDPVPEIKEVGAA